MAYNINTGETTLNGRTYTPHPRGARLSLGIITHLADTNANITDRSNRNALIGAVRSIYRIHNSRTAFTVGRSMVRALRAENAA